MHHVGRHELQNESCVLTATLDRLVNEADYEAGLRCDLTVMNNGVHQAEQIHWK